MMLLKPSLHLGPYQNLTLSKLKTPADKEFSVAHTVGFVIDRIENIVEKGENVGYQQFLLCPQRF